MRNGEGSAGEAGRGSDRGRPRLRVRDVRASLASGAKDPWSVSWFGRPLGNLLTPLAWRFGLSADAVTYLHLIVSVSGLVALAMPGRVTAAAAAFAFYLGFVLDCVDGNLARLRDAATYYGKLVDGLVDASYLLLAPIAAGAGLLVADGDVVAFVIGAVTSVLGLLAQLIQAKASFLREMMYRLSADQLASPPPTERERTVLERASGAVLVNGTFLAPLVLLLPDGRWIYLIVLIFLQAPADVLSIVASMLKARATLRVWRRSRHAASS